MSKQPLCVAILWHMHQPDYGNTQTGEVYLPWTRLHAVKDYYDMGALIEEQPGLRLTINVVPALVDQLRAYGKGGVRETYAALTLRRPDALDRNEKLFLLRSFFQLPWQQMVFPYPRYKTLLERRGSPNERGEYADGLKRYTAQDFRDLQVWFNLSWCGRELRKDPEIAALIEKGRDFTEDEKERLLAIHYRFIGEILPLYARLRREHGIELSVSPYYHPILPLLCDNRSAREALPDLVLPNILFASPGDAQEQLLRAQRCYVEEFGEPPLGLWPSEGSISDATMELARKTGFRWLASDDGVLINSLKNERLPAAAISLQDRFSAYRWGEGDHTSCLFFRDHGLSDLIGFTYSRWNASDASADFLNRLRSIHRDLPDDGRHYVVPIILDGENAWEHYPENGSEFLRLLYRDLTTDEHLRTVTFSEFLELEPHREALNHIAAGSWIYNNLATWIGHPEKNRAWELLAEARSFLSSSQRDGAGEESLERAFQELMIAEGSDWFWWYGDDHHTDNAAEFDLLFRNHVKNVYWSVSGSYPLELDAPIKKLELKALYRDPVHTISPRLDGKVTDYFEWLAAGFALPGAGGSMHRAERYLEKVFFGYDTHQFYLRIDLTTKEEILPSTACLQIHFVAPREVIIRLDRNEEQNWDCRWADSLSSDPRPAFGADRILEVGIPLEHLQVRNRDEVRFFVAVLKDDRELERFPPNDVLVVPVDPSGLDHQEWMV